MINNSRTINIFGTTYTIEYVDKIKEENQADDMFTEGICHSGSCQIQVATKFKDGSDMSKSVIEKNTIHEIIHAILNEGQYIHCSDDEPLVEWLARCIYSLNKQGAF